MLFSLRHPTIFPRENYHTEKVVDVKSIRPYIVIANKIS